MSLDSILRATGKNLLPNPNVHAYNYSSDYKKYNNTDEIFLTAGTYSVSVSANCPTLQFWNVTTKQQYTVDEAVSAYSTNTYYKIYDGFALGKASDAVRQMWFTLKINALITLNSGNTNGTSQECQIEKGSTATNYEPYEYLGPKTIKMSSSSKNLIPYPYATTSKTISGVTFTVQEDGGIKVEGTPNNPVSMFYISTPANTISALKIGNTYTLSGYRSGSGATLVYINTEVSDSYTFTCDAQNPLIGIKVVQGTTANALFYPQLEEGTVATDFSLNTGSKEVLKVSYNNKNLFNEKSITACAARGTASNNYGQVTTEYLLSKYATYGIGTYWTGFQVYLKANTNYTISADAYYATSSNNKKDVNLGVADTNYKFTSKEVKLSANDIWERVSITISVNQDGYYWLQAQPSGNATQFTALDCRFKNVQVEFGENATDYVPYFNTVIWTKA